MVIVMCRQCEFADTYPFFALDKHGVVNIGFSDYCEPKCRRETKCLFATNIGTVTFWSEVKLCKKATAEFSAKPSQITNTVVVKI